jgi:hypothetical protein
VGTIDALVRDLRAMDAEGAIDLTQWPAAAALVAQHDETREPQAPYVVNVSFPRQDRSVDVVATSQEEAERLVREDLWGYVDFGSFRESLERHASYEAIED